MCQERKGKKWERERNGKGTRSFLSRSSIFRHPFFPVSGQNHERRRKKEAKRPKNGCKDVERPRTAVLRRSRFSNLARFRFLYRLKPVFAPVPTRFLPCSNPVFYPFLFLFLCCLAIISRCAPIAAQPLDHVGPSLVRGTSGKFVFTARRR